MLISYGGFDHYGSVAGMNPNLITNNNNSLLANGDRSGTLEDPFGHVWTIATHKEDLTMEEMQKRAQAAMKP